MSIYSCNECKDLAYRALHAKLNEFLKLFDKRTKDANNTTALAILVETLNDLEDLIMRN